MKKQSEKDFFDYMDGYCLAYESLSPYAHTEACKAGVESWNKTTGDNKNPLSWVLKWKLQRQNIA